MSSTPRPLTLIILDGWGCSEDTDSNAIFHAPTPTWDKLLKDFPNTLIQASGRYVGLPDSQMGNSEVGHLNIGAGRVVYQDFTRISLAIEDRSFFDNAALCAAVDKAVSAGKAVHVFGLLSPGGVHSHEDHIVAMLELAAERGAEQIYLHAFLDGRDTPPKSAQPSIELIEQTFSKLGKGRFATVSGRYYAMDRDNRWERVQPAYEAIAAGVSEHTASSAAAALEASYQRQETDEFVRPTVIIPEGGSAVRVEDGDAIVFMNFRADRAREITRCFVEAGFDGFGRSYCPQLSDFVCLTEYQKDFGTPLGFPPETLHNGFGEYLASLGKKQLRIAETEKYAHVTFFFNGGEETVYAGEDRQLVASPKVATYDLQPEMSAPEVTEKLIAAIQSGTYDAIVCNYANGDMVGHTGVFDAALQAAQTIDKSLKAVTEAALAAGGEVLITADHGNIEKMSDSSTGQAHTAHSTNPVHFIYVGERAVEISNNGALSDIAPTMLYLMGLEIPAEMTGKPLLSLLDSALEKAS